MVFWVFSRAMSRSWGDRVIVGVSVLLALLTLATGTAQADSSPRFGVEVGVAWAHLGFSAPEALSLAEDRYGTRTGLRGGLRVRFSLGTWLGAVLGLSLESNGESVNLGPNAGTIEERFWYLTVPVLGEVVAVRTDSVEFFARCGFEPGLLIDADSIAKDEDGQEQQTIDVDDWYRSLELTGLFGGGARIAATWELQVMYRVGLRDISGVDGDGEGSIRNRAVAVGLVHWLW